MLIKIFTEVINFGNGFTAVSGVEDAGRILRGYRMGGVRFTQCEGDSRIQWTCETGHISL